MLKKVIYDISFLKNILLKNALKEKLFFKDCFMTLKVVKKIERKNGIDFYKFLHYIKRGLIYDFSLDLFRT